MRFPCIVTDLHVFVMKNDVGSLRICSNMARSRNHCCHRISTMIFLSTVELHVSVNNIKPLSVAMEIQGWVKIALFYWYKIKSFCCTKHKRKFSDIFVRFETNICSFSTEF